MNGVPPSTLWTYVGETTLAFLAGIVVAATQVSTALSGGDEELPDRKRRQASATFIIALLAAPLFGGVMTQPLVAFTHGAAPWPAAAVVVGISANAVWPIIGPLLCLGISAEFKGRLKAALNILANGDKPAIRTSAGC